MAGNMDHTNAAEPFPFPPLIYVGNLVLGMLLDRLVPLPFPSGYAFHIVGFALLAGGLLLGGSAVVTMRREHTSPNPHKPPTALIEKGPFRYGRNPIYLSLFVTYAGIATYASSLWAILLLPVVFWLIDNWVVKREENYMEQKFGDAYRSYKSRVRRWI